MPSDRIYVAAHIPPILHGQLVHLQAYWQIKRKRRMSISELIAIALEKIIEAELPKS